MNQNALQLASMKRVNTVGGTAQSYVGHKLNGDQNAMGGSGGRMPQGGPFMDPGNPQRTFIETWINSGAPLR